MMRSDASSMLDRSVARESCTRELLIVFATGVHQIQVQILNDVIDFTQVLLDSFGKLPCVHVL